MWRGQASPSGAQSWRKDNIAPCSAARRVLCVGGDARSEGKEKGNNAAAINLY